MTEKTFDASRAQKFRGVGPKMAVLNQEGAIYVKPSWAGHGDPPALQTFNDRHYTISIPLFDADGNVTGWDVWGSDEHEFESTHRYLGPFPGMPENLGGIWVKDADGVTVEAYQLTDADDRSGATVLAGATEAETSDVTTPVGHWRIRQPGGEVQDTPPAQFDYLYELVEDSIDPELS